MNNQHFQNNVFSKPNTMMNQNTSQSPPRDDKSLLDGLSLLNPLYNNLTKTGSNNDTNKIPIQSFDQNKLNPLAFPLNSLNFNNPNSFLQQNMNFQGGNNNQLNVGSNNINNVFNLIQGLPGNQIPNASNFLNNQALNFNNNKLNNNDLNLLFNLTQMNGNRNDSKKE